jgi:hypothetical protein
LPDIYFPWTSSRMNNIGSSPDSSILISKVSNSSLLSIPIILPTGLSNLLAIKTWQGVTSESWGNSFKKKHIYFELVVIGNKLSKMYSIYRRLHSSSFLTSELRFRRLLSKDIPLHRDDKLLWIMTNSRSSDWTYRMTYI